MDILFEGKRYSLGGSSSSSSGSTEVINAPIGSIMAWAGTTEDIPTGWHICDGQEGTIDLRDKFILGAGENHPIGDTGGEEEVTLTVEQMPEHSHGIRVSNGIPTSSYVNSLVSPGLGGVGSASQQNIASRTGSSQPHPNMPPYYALLYIQKIAPSPTDSVTEKRVEEIVDNKLDNVSALLATI